MFHIVFQSEIKDLDLVFKLKEQYHSVRYTFQPVDMNIIAGMLAMQAATLNLCKLTANEEVHVCAYVCVCMCMCLRLPETLNLKRNKSADEYNVVKSKSFASEM